MLRRSLSNPKSRTNEFISIGGTEHRRLVRRSPGAVGDRTALREFDLFLADEPAVNNQSETHQKWNYSGEPKTTQDFCIARVPARNDSLHESVEKDHDAQADGTGDNAGFDFRVAFHGGCAALALKLFLAPLMLEHLGDPGSAPI